MKYLDFFIYFSLCLSSLSVFSYDGESLNGTSLSLKDITCEEIRTYSSVENAFNDLAKKLFLTGKHSGSPLSKIKSQELRIIILDCIGEDDYLLGFRNHATSNIYDVQSCDNQ